MRWREFVLKEYIKRADNPKSSQKEVYHWNAECPDSPKRGTETVLIFHEKPINALPCQKCSRIDEEKKAKKAKARKPPK